MATITKTFKIGLSDSEINGFVTKGTHDYLASASVNNNTLTITYGDGTTVSFAGGGGNNYYHVPLFNTGLNIANGSGVNNMYVPDASTSQSGVVTTGSQSFTGEKTFVAKDNGTAVSLQIDNDNEFGISICDKHYTTHKYYFGLATTNTTHDMKINIPFESTSSQNTYTLATREWVSSQGYVTSDTNYYHTPYYSSGLNIAQGHGVNALFVPVASDTQVGLMSTGNQTYAGNKTFKGNILPNGQGATNTLGSATEYWGSTYTETLHLGSVSGLSCGAYTYTLPSASGTVLTREDFEYNSTTRVLKLKWL